MNNDKHLAFLKELSYTGTINDAYRAYLLAQLGVTSNGTIDDLLYRYLKLWNYSGSLDDMLAAHLRYLGYSGSVADMLAAAWPAAGIAGMSFAASLKTSLIPEYAAGSKAPTYTRATTATVTDHENIVRPVLSGEARFQGARRVRNLVTGSSSDFSNAAWFKQSGVSVTGTRQVNFDGTLNGRLSNVAPLTSAVTVAVRFKIRLLSGAAPALRFWGIGTVASEQLLPTLTSEWQTVGITGPGNTDYVGIIDRAGSVFSVEIDEFQVENVTGQSNQAPAEYVSVGVLSAPYHGAGVDGVKYFSTTNGNSVANNVVTEAAGTAISSSTLLGYLSEGARTNLCLQSNAFTTTPWVVSSGSNLQNVTGPDGATSAWTCPGSGTQSVQQDMTLTAANYTTTFFIKKTTGVSGSFPVIRAFASPLTALCTVDTNNGTATAWTALTGGWTIQPTSTSVVSFGSFWRVSLTFLATAATWTVGFYPAGATTATQSTGSIGGGTLSAVFFGGQTELGSFASTYIPTTTASVPRNADVLTYPSSGNVGSVGTFYAESNSATTISARVLSTGPIAAGSYSTLNPDGGYSWFAVGSNGTALANVSNKLSASFNGTAFSHCQNGGSVTSGTSDFTGVGITDIGVACRTNGSQQLFGTIRNVRIYSTQLSATRLALLTT